MIKELRSNKDIVITRPDKGAGVVLLDRCDYVQKMSSILDDENKFEKLGPTTTHDDTSKTEADLQRYLLGLSRRGEISQEEYERIRPKGCQRPRMYGLPKVHKDNTPLRPILSMTGSAQHETAKWLKELLQPVVEKYGEHSIVDTYSFVDNIRSKEAGFLCSFDVVSLFTNVPIDETINICASALYHSDISPPQLTETSFRELMAKVTKEVHFSFNDVMYRQIDGVAMGSPLGPVLANIFVGFEECRLLRTNDITLPQYYGRYVDDICTIFNSESEAEEFNKALNEIHPSLRFTIERESNNSLPFLDVEVVKSDNSLLTKVYRKPTFTGLYTRWESYSSRKQKLNLISTLTRRAKKICSEVYLENELNNVRSIFKFNGYPDSVVELQIQRTLDKIKQPPCSTVPKCPVYLRLPWMGNYSIEVNRQFNKLISSTYPAAQLRIINSKRPAFPGTQKDILPAHSKSNVIYSYRCCCDQQYVGRTTLRLEARIKQHVPDRLLNPSVAARSQPRRSCKRKAYNTKEEDKETLSSAIGLHLLNNDHCAVQYSNEQFSVIKQCRSEFHLKVAEAVIIRRRKPILCRQKEHIFTLRLL